MQQCFLAKKELEIIENARRLKEFEENERLEKQKRKERNARRERLKIEKEKRIKNRNGNFELLFLVFDVFKRLKDLYLVIRNLLN